MPSTTTSTGTSTRSWPATCPHAPSLVLLLKSHIDREENGLFPSALAFLADDQWETIHSPTLMQD